MGILSSSSCLYLTTLCLDWLIYTASQLSGISETVRNGMSNLNDLFVLFSTYSVLVT